MFHMKYICIVDSCNRQSQNMICCGSPEYGCVGSTMSLNRKNLYKYKKDGRLNLCHHHSKPCKICQNNNNNTETQHDCNENTIEHIDKSYFDR